jgi:AbrB family looped-hinge helix DNA binding protein
MSTNSKESIKMKVFPKGQIVIPIALRKKYHIEIGDQLDVIPSRDGILLKPVPKETKKNSLTNQLFGVFGKYAHQTSNITKKDVIMATETEFVKGWSK